MSTRITDLPQAETLNGSEVMPLVQNGVTKKATLDFINLAAPAALILQQTQQVYQDTVDVKTATDAVLIETQSVLTDTQNVLGQTVTVRDQTEALKLDFETQYLGPHASPPTLDNEGNPLENGALYWDTTLMAMFVWSGVSWTAFSSAVASVNGFIGEVILNFQDVGAAGPGANTNITSLGGLTGDVATATGMQFDTAAPSAGAVGKLTWNTTDQTLDLGVSASGGVLQVGQEVYYRVKNGTAGVIPNGSMVRYTGTEGLSGTILVAPALADGTYASQTFLGLTTEVLNPGDSGFATHFGRVRGIDTTGNPYGEVWADGDVIFASALVSGWLTKVLPAAPNNRVRVGIVVHAHPNGVLFVNPTCGGKLSENEQVNLASLADGDVLQYDADLGRFENRTLSGAGIEPLGAAADSMAAHLAALDPHPQYTTPAEAAAAAPVQSVAGKTGAVLLAKADVGLANVDNTSDLNKPVSTATQNALNLKLNSNDPSVTNAREWTAQTVSQVEAEAGTATTRRAWTAERVFQAIAAWWNASAFKTKLDGIQAGAQVNTVNSVAGRTGAVSLTKADVELGNVTNDAQLKIVSNLSDLNNATTARTNLGLGTAATATVTTSATDTTEGRLLKVGDFGLGALVTTDTSAASVAGSGLYRATSGQPSAPNAHLLHISRVASAQGAQMAIEDLSSSDVPRAYVRHRGSDGVWAGWHELYHKGNILGTVSQASGVPTGAIIERGSNANGEYVRFADGTQICVTRTGITTTSAFTNVFGTTSGTSYRNLFNWTYPAAFSAQPMVSAGTANVASPTEFSAVLPTSAIVLAYSSVNGAVISTFCFAIGRWF